MGIHTGVCRRGALLAAAVVVTTATPQHAAARDAVQYRYAVWGGGSGVFAIAAQQSTPAGHAALDGWFEYTARSDHITVTMDDLGVRRGRAVPIAFGDYGGPEVIFDGCVRDSRPMTFGGVRAGQRLAFRIGYSTPGYPARCARGAIAGTVTVQG